MALTDIAAHSTLKTGLLAYYKMEGNARDSWGTNNGTAEKAITTAAGKFSNAIAFDGNGDPQDDIGAFQVINLGQLLAGQNSFSLSYWNKLNSVSAFQQHLSLASWNGSVMHSQSRLCCQHPAGSSGNVDFYYYGANGGCVEVFAPLTISAWTHWAVVLDYNATSGVTTLTIYKNGSLVGSNSGSIGAARTGTIPLLVGAICWDYFGTNKRLHQANGTIDEIAIANRAWTASEVADLYNSGNGLPLERFPSVKNHPTLKTGLVGYYSLETDASDSSGNGRNGSEVGSPVHAIAKVRSGVTLNGTNQYVNLGASNDFAPATGISVFGWMYVDSTGGTWQWLADKYDGDSHPSDASWGILFGNTDNTLYVAACSGSSEYWLSQGSYSSLKNSWHHVGFTYDNATLKMYVDGAFVKQMTGGGAVNQNATEAHIGHRYNLTVPIHEYFKGKADEMGIWSRALSTDEIADLYNSGMGLPWDGAFTSISDHPTLPGGLLAHWPFDGNVNEVQGRFNGVQSGTPSWGLGKDGLCIVQSEDAQYVDFGNSAILNPQKMSIAFWTIPYGTSATNYFIGRQDGGSRPWALTRLGYNPLRFQITRDAGDESYASLTVDLDTWNFILGTYDGTDIKLSKNLDSPGVTNFPGTIKALSNHVWLGRQYKNFAAIDGISIWDRAITDLEKFHLYNFGNGLPYLVPPTDINTSATLKTGLVSYWKLDADANDCVGSHHGALENSPSNVTAKLRKGYLLAKASSQAIRVPHHADFNTQAFSYSIWYKPSSIDSVAPGAVLAKRNADASRNAILYQHNQSASPGTVFAVWTSGGEFDVFGTQPTVGVWRHAVIVCSGSEIRLYENGQLKGTTAITGTVNYIADDLTFGRLCGSSNFNRFDGIIDEPAFWNRALSGDEVLQLYNAGVGITYDGTFTCISDHPSLTNGMIAGYPLGDVFDVGPNAFHGTLEGVPTLVPGKSRSCYRLSGSGQAIKLTDDLKLAPTTGITVACWAKIEGAAARQWQMPVSRFYYGWNAPVGESGNCYGIQYDYSAKRWYWWCANGTVSRGVDVVQNTDGAWAFLVGTWDGYLVRFFINGVEVRYPGTLTGPLNQVAGLFTLIGSRMGDGNLPPQGRFDYMNGKVDGVYFWNRALIQSEILNLYSSGAGLSWTALPIFTTILDHPTLKNGLIAHYAFEDNVNDSQGNFNGTAVGTPTYEGGKIGQAIRLNGSSQYVNLGTDTRLNPGCITVAGWIKFYSMGGAGVYPGIICRRDTGDWSYGLSGANGNAISWTVYTTGGLDNLDATFTSSGSWHHIAATYDGSYLRISIDGEEVAEKLHTYQGRIAYRGAFSATIGKTPGYADRYVNGWMDGWGIWDHALTESEIKALYNQGNGLPFGTFTPATSIADHRSLKHGLVSFHGFNNSLLDNFCVNDGSMGSGVPSYASGKFPGTQAIEFSGAAGSLVAMPNGQIHNHRYLGVAGWIWLDSGSGVQELVCKLSNAGTVWDFYGGANWCFGVNITGYNYVTLARSEGTGQWHFFCGYFDGRTIFMRINERTVTDNVTGWIQSNATLDAIPVRFGAAGSADGNGDYRLDGRVCCVAVWDRPLMPSEITDLWNSGNGLPLGTIAAPTDITTHLTLKEDLIGHWSFQADASEDSGNLINGTLVNTPLFQAGKVGNAIRIAQPHTHEHVWFDPDKFSPHFNSSRFSLALWVYLFEHPKNESGGDHRYSAIVAKSAYNGYDYVQFHLLHWSASSDDRYIEFTCRDINNSYKSAGAVQLADLNVWMNIAAIVDGKEIALFKNGVCVNKTSFTSGVYVTDFPLRLGFRGNGRGMTQIIIPDSMQGCSKKDLDQFLFAARALTYKEVADLYNRGSGLPYLAPPGAAPNVVSASATGDTTIRVTYDKEVKHSSGSGQYDSLNPANYEFAGDVEIDATDVDLVTENPTVVDVTVDGEMTLGESYLMSVSNVQDLEDRNLDEDTASFTGHGTQPQVASCAVLTSRKIRIVFDSLMTHNGALTDPGSYSFDGGLTSASGIIATDEGGVTKVEVPFTGTPIHGTTYHCEVSLVVDLSENVIDPAHDVATFTGLSPRVSSVALVAGKIRVTFNSEMKHISDSDPDDSLYVAGYSVDGPTELTITDVELGATDPTIVDLVFTGDMTDGEEYTVTATCKHVTGSPLDVDDGLFLGSGTAPQLSGVDFILPDILVFIFDKFMKEDVALLNPENYRVTGVSELTVASPEVANAVDHTTVRTTVLGSIRKHGQYLASVIGVTDTAENPIDLEHNSAEFVGQLPGIFRAPIWLSPPGEKVFGAVEAPGVQVQEKKTEEV